MAAIHQHQVEELTEEIARALEHAHDHPVNRQVITTAIEHYFTDLCAITWTSSDVRSECPGLTIDEAREVLEELVDDHDATLGVTYDRIASTAYRLFGEKADADADSADEDSEDEDETPGDTNG